MGQQEGVMVPSSRPGGLAATMEFLQGHLAGELPQCDSAGGCMYCLKHWLEVARGQHPGPAVCTQYGAEASATECAVRWGEVS